MKHGFIWKIRSFLRFLIYRFRYGSAFKACRKGLIGTDTHLYFSYPGAQVQIGERMILGNHIEMIAKGKLDIGTNLSMSEYSRIVAHHQIQIGNRVTIARFVSILDHDHHCEMKNGKMEMQGYDVDPIRIGNQVWIGDKVSILKGSEIGSNIIIAANSVVKGKLEDNGIYAGAPAKRIKDIQ
jgi:acetyltransferase-like isoleucine patch superfamily enzyme